MIEGLFRDTRLALRSVGRRPGFTAIAVLSLALGIAPTSAVSSLINAVVLRPAPVRDATALRAVEVVGRKGSGGFSYPLFIQMSERSDVFSELFAYYPTTFTVRVGDAFERTSGQFVSSNYAQSLGGTVALGRALTPDDGRTIGGHPVAVLSHAYWKRRFGLDPTVLDKPLVVNGTPLTVVGVWRESFVGIDPGHPVDITVPIVMQPVLARPSRLEDPHAWWALRVVGRLAPGMDERQAEARLGTVLSAVLAGAPMSPEDRQQFFDHVELTQAAVGLTTLRREVQTHLKILLAIGVVILLIAFSNTLNLLLARTASRAGEIRMRLALGASRASLLRQFAVESLLFSLFAAAAAFLLATWAVQVLVSMVPSTILPSAQVLAPDGRVLGFTIALAAVLGLLVGVTPALAATRPNLATELRKSATSVRGGTGKTVFMIALVVQAALSLALLNGAGLFVRSLQNLNAVDVGFSRDQILLFTVRTGQSGYKGERLKNAYKQVLDRVGQLNGVREATVCAFTPMSGADKTRFIAVTGYSPRLPDDSIVHVNPVGPGYATTFGVPLAAGRDFSARDSETAAPVAMMNEAAARHYFGTENPLGRQISILGSPPIEIVGVAKDTRYRTLREAADRMVYLPFLQVRQTDDEMTYALRTSADSAGIAAAIRGEVAAAASGMVVTEIRTLSDQVSATILPERLVAWLSTVLGVLGLALSCIGLYGTMSHAVAQRTNEIGVRMALGADGSSVVRLVLRETMTLVGVGIVLGVLTTRLAAPLASSILYGLSSTDPLTIVYAIGVLLSVTIVAVVIPASRAARVDPVTALRNF